MRGKPSKQKSFKTRIDNNLDKLKEKPRLSSAYIGSLVKHLASSGMKNTMNSLHSSLVIDGGEGFPPHRQSSMIMREPQQPEPLRRPMKRRLLTARPYQGHLLNMAEARKEIITDLTHHRGSTNQANENRRQPRFQPSPQPPTQPLQPSPQPEHEPRPISSRNSQTYASSSWMNFANDLDTMSCQSFPYQTPQMSYSWPMSASPTFPENFNLLLPDQTLGTSLSHNNNIPSPYYLSPSTSSYPLSLTTEDTAYTALSETSLVGNSGDLRFYHAMYDEEVANSGEGDFRFYHAMYDEEVANSGEGDFRFYHAMYDEEVANSGVGDLRLYHAIDDEEVADSGEGDLGLHHAMDDEEVASSGEGDLGLHHAMGEEEVADSGEGDLGLNNPMDYEERAEIRSACKQLEIEWDDTVNLVTSAWWFNILKTLETDSNIIAEEDGFYPFNEVMEFPTGLNANESSLEQLDDHGSGDYFKDPALACMDNGEIEELIENVSLGMSN